MTLADKLARYVRRFLARNQEWPTVRQAARALGLPQGHIEEIAQEDPFMLTFYNTEWEEPIGGWYIELLEEEDSGANDASPSKPRKGRKD